MEAWLSKRLKLLVSVALLAWLVHSADWSKIGHTFSQLRPGLWLAAVVLYIATQFVSAVRWRLLAGPLGFHKSMKEYTAFYFIGMYFNLFLPTSVGGDVVRALYLDGGSGRRLPAFLSVFVDRLSGLLVLLALACVAAAFCPMPLPLWITASVWGTAGCAMLGFLLLPFVLRWTGRFEHICRLVQGLRLYVSQPRLLLATTGLSLVVQAANILLVWLVGLAIAAPVPMSYYGILVPMVTLLTLLPVSLNGMGVREWGTVLFLSHLGISEATGLILAFLWFAAFTTVSL